MKHARLLKAVALSFAAVMAFGSFPALLPAAALQPLLVLNATDGVCSGKARFYGAKAGDLGLSGGSVEGTLTFSGLPLGKGDYFLMIYYASGSSDRYFTVKSEGSLTRVDCPDTGSFDTVVTVGVPFAYGGGDLCFGSDWYAPDLLEQCGQLAAVHGQYLVVHAIPPEEQHEGLFGTQL